jgi:hypothetical protein
MKAPQLQLKTWNDWIWYFIVITIGLILSRFFNDFVIKLFKLC